MLAAMYFSDETRLQMGRNGQNFSNNLHIDFLLQEECLFLLEIMFPENPRRKWRKYLLQTRFMQFRFQRTIMCNINGAETGFEWRTSPQHLQKLEFTFLHMQNFIE
jgi:hypothetical protein